MDKDSMNSDSGDPGIAHRGEYFADDPYIFEAEISPWEIIATPIEQKPFRHWKRYLITPSLIVYRESFDAAVRLRGLAPVGMLSLTLPLNLGKKSSYWNETPRANGFYASNSGSVDAVFDGGQEHIMVLIDVKLLRQMFPPHIVLALEDAARNRFVCASSSAVNELTCWLCSVLDEAAKYPRALHNIAVQAFEEELLDRLLRTAQLEGPPKHRPHLLLRKRGLDRALRFLRKSERPDWTVPKLCAAANVSQRSLEYAFKEEFGLTPLGFLRLRRFHYARYDLMAAFSSGETTIAEIAHRNGFLQLGRFARDYRNLFGELPSHTLQRDFPEMLKGNFPLLW